MPPKTLKVSSENQWFQRVETLKRNRKKRQQYRQFSVEGVQSINQLVANETWEIEAFLYSRERSHSDWLRGVLSTSRARFHLELTDALMNRLSDKDEPSELLAIVNMLPDDPQRIPIREDALIVLADRPQSPGNLGALIRSCDGLGAHGLVVTGHAVDIYEPRTIRAAAGSFFVLPTVRMASNADILAWLDELRLKLPQLQIVGTSAGEHTHITDCAFNRPTVLLVGNEANGLSHWFHAHYDVIASIPMQGTVPSLNMACAATAVLYEIQRQRLGALQQDTSNAMEQRVGIDGKS